MDALTLWQGVQTQWRMVSEIGATGLEYEGVRASPAFRAIQRDKRERVFGDLCVIEGAALREWGEMRDERRRAGGR